MKLHRALGREGGGAGWLGSARQNSDTFFLYGIYPPGYHAASKAQFVLYAPTPRGMCHK
jgi:hypothetical protein